MTDIVKEFHEELVATLRLMHGFSSEAAETAILSHKDIVEEYEPTVKKNEELPSEIVEEVCDRICDEVYGGFYA